MSKVSIASRICLILSFMLACFAVGFPGWTFKDSRLLGLWIDCDATLNNCTARDLDTGAAHMKFNAVRATETCSVLFYLVALFGICTNDAVQATFTLLGGLCSAAGAVVYGLDKKSDFPFHVSLWCGASATIFALISFVLVVVKNRKEDE